MTDNKITKELKNSLLSDNAIKLGLALHKENPGMFRNLINKFEADIKMMAVQCGDVYQAYLDYKDMRVMRFGLDERVERTIVSLVASISKYKQEIAVGDLKSQVKVFSK
jgi:hypothetical protein